MKLRFVVTMLMALTACQSKPIKPAYVENQPLNSGELPVKAFASLPLFDHMTWSPNGQYVAFIQNNNGKRALVTQDRNGGNSHVLLVSSDDEQSSIRNYQWVNDERLLVSAIFYESIRDLKVTETRSFAINRDGSDPKYDLIKIRDNQNLSQYQDNFSKIPDDNKRVFIELDNRKRGAPDVFKMDVYSGEMERVVSNPGYVRDWKFDQQGHVRFGVGYLGTTIRIIHRLNEDDDWTTIVEKENSQNHFHPLGFSEDPNVLFFSDSYNGKQAIFKADVKNLAKRDLVYADPKYDVDGGLLYSKDNKRVIGVGYSAEKGKAIYWDDEAKKLQERFNSFLKGTKKTVISSHDKQHLILVSSSNYAPTYFLFDENKNSASEVAKLYPDINNNQLSKTEFVTIKARDGLMLDGYITKPLKANAGQTIVFPHGGPWARDTEQFNYWAQFMVNRGWNVLQLNFRGSDGYGESFVQSGFKRWGLEMQDDITDGVHWLVDNKIADPKKVCIVGGSYGGYATLMGLVKTPDLYQCGVSFAPVTDLLELVDALSDKRWMESELRSEVAESRLGHWWSDRSRLKATSPVNLAANFHTPLLLVHGVEDSRVAVSHSRNLASELKSVGFKDYQYLEMEKGDHFLSREQDRLEFFQAMDAFLRKYH